MDHFVGFDHLLRIVLRREKALRVYGPPGIIDNIEGKLSGYTWNLTEGYPFVLHVTEVYPDKIKRCEFCAEDGFKRRDLSFLPFSGTLLDEEMFTVHACHLDHKIPSLGVALKERFHVNINKDKLDRLGLSVGPWLKKFKQALWEGVSENENFTITSEGDSGMNKREYPLGELKELIATITEGQKLSYIVDAVYNRDNEEKIISLAEGSDIMYCEAAYLDKDMAMAAGRFHLTARQAGELARKTDAKNLVIFHFSPRYKDDPDALYNEAMHAFREVS